MIQSGFYKNEKSLYDTEYLKGISAKQVSQSHTSSSIKKIFTLLKSLHQTLHQEKGLISAMKEVAEKQ